jgi:hypothetical protein
MQFLMLATFFAACVVDHLASYTKILPRYFAYAPDVFSAIAFLYIIIAGAHQRFRYVRPMYWIAFGFVGLTMICGIATNGVGPGPVVSGIRLYLQAIPFFFVPAVYEFSPQQIRTQFKFLLYLGLAQLPMSAYQRLTLMAQDRFSGDPVRGTLVDSSVLSIYLICVVCVLTGMFMQKRISKWWYLGLFAVLLIPTTINETKATLILLPIGLVFTLILGAPWGQRLRMAVLAGVLLVSFTTVFAGIYDYVQRNNPYYVSIEDFFTNRKALKSYVAERNADVGGERPGRVDAIIIPLKYLAHDPVKLTFGLGIGNVSRSSLGPAFTGDYFSMFELLTESSLCIFILEIGVLGTAGVFLLHWLIFEDARALTTQDSPGQIKDLALGWLGITALLTIALAYKTTHIFGPLAYLFWFYSGVVAARRMRLESGVIIPDTIALPVAPVPEVPKLRPKPAVARPAPLAAPLRPPRQ